MNQKRKIGKRIAAWLMCMAMVLTTMNLPAFVSTVHAASWERIDFLITGSAAKFVADESARYMPVATNSEGKITNLPELFTTNTPAENSHYVFDGWYTARDGGEKVTTDTVFTEYTVLYDHWHAEDLAPGKIVKAVTIGNGQLSNNQTITDYNNSSTAPSTGVTGGRDYDIYEGVNASGRKLGDSDRIQAGKSYSVVTTISVADGYYLGKGIEVNVENGQRANIKYIGSPVKGKYNQWFEGATRLEVCINFPSPTFKYDFTTQPVGGATYNESQYDYTWALSDTPISVSLEQKNDDLWAYIGDATGKTPVYKNCKKTYRLVATYPEGVLYSNAFDVTYSEDGKTHDVIWFTTQPQSGRVVNNEDFKYLFALNMEPSIIRVEKKRNSSDEFDYYSGKATGVLSGLDKENRTDTFRLVAYLDGESAYSDEFTVTWYEDSHVCSEGDPEDEVEVLPTCTKDGYYDFTLYCVTCHKEMQKRHIVLPKTDLGHTYGTPVIENITATCGQAGTYEEVEYCLECNKRRWRNTYSIPATGNHDFYESGTYNPDKEKCTLCNIKNINYKGITVGGTSLAYNGSLQSPSLVLKDKSGNVISASNYDVAVTKKQSAGNYTLTITGKGDYAGTRTVAWSISDIKAPTISSVKNVATGIELKWNKAANADGYVIYRKTASSGWTAIKTITSQNTVSYVDTTAKANTTYTYAIKSTKGSVQSSLSATKSYKRILATKITETKNLANGVKITWSKVTGADSYMVYRRTATSGWTFLKKTSDLSLIDYAPKSGYTYYYGIIAYSGSEKSALSENVSHLRIATPQVTATKVSNGIKVNWLKISVSDSYMVYRRTATSGWTFVKTIKGNTNISFTDTTAKAGVSYSYGIVAVAPNGKKSACGSSNMVKR